MSDVSKVTVRQRSALGRVRGMGSAKQGSHHWWVQRISSMALLPLMLWFVISVASLAGHSYADTILWIGHPFNATLLLLTIAIGFQHTASGLQVVIEDYVADEMSRMAAVLAVKAACTLFGVLAALAVLKIAV
ncbi:succinate dehydrogenase, hydrophobic membrane anchor protein [Roseomonas sp. M0104]|uniref:Succinate dehydrogenase hydrophobic membrane anchor subunit n=1 Tax=Teichococcus coralli TaxID=2545983 RepID=A0A845BJE3_9PROT|nr:succinate dehydrogenase, hydrophobic membrane anchor protein [Pseudoroseomonas coralli]MXP65417.1 succinate dehydrogenase, hydrophobic membrane anchor protein [Pseudoroseomonas coralli]